MSWQLLELWKSVPNYVSPYKTSYFAQFVADTQADLPARVQNDYIIELGSKCHVVADNSDWEIKSDGTWVETQMGTDVYSRAQIDAMLATKQNTLTFDSIPTENSTNPVYSGGVWAVAEFLIDKPGKNQLQNTGTTTTVGGEVTFTVNSDGSIDAEVIATVTSNRSFTWISSLPAGTWFYSTGNSHSGVTPAPCFSAVNKSGAQIANDFNNQVITRNEETNYQFQFTIRTTAEVGDIYHFEPMICTPLEYQISNKFIPYAST